MDNIAEPRLNDNEQDFVDRKGVSERAAPASPTTVHSKQKFMTGFNWGQAAEAGMRTPDREILDRSPEFKFGYVYGVIERRLGNIHDNESCGRRIDFSWTLFNSEAYPPMTTRLP